MITRSPTASEAAPCCTTEMIPPPATRIRNSAFWRGSTLFRIRSRRSTLRPAVSESPFSAGETTGRTTRIVPTTASDATDRDRARWVALSAAQPPSTASTAKITGTTSIDWHLFGRAIYTSFTGPPLQQLYYTAILFASGNRLVDYACHYFVIKLGAYEQMFTHLER